MSAQAAGRERGLERIAASLTIAFATLLLIPWHPLPEPYALDRAWTLVLHLAWVRGAAFGREIVFSYGPWGFLWRGYHPETWGLVLAAWALFGAASAAAIWASARRTMSRASALVAVALAVFVVLSRGREVLLMALPLLWFLEGRESASSLRFGLLTVATTLAALGKFSLLLLLVPLALLLAADEVARRRRVPFGAAFAAGMLLAWWLVAGQRLADFLPFVSNGLEIAGGFADAMAVDPPRATFPLAAVLAVSAILLFLSFAGERDPRARVADLLAFAVALFLTFKAGFVRWDAAHAGVAYGVLLIFAVVAIARAWPAIAQRPTRLAPLAAAVPILLAAGTALDAADRADSGLVPALRGVGAVVSRGWGAHSAGLRAEHRRFLRGEGESAGDLPLEGTVDVYPNLASVAAARSGYAPRPVFQSYVAFTPGLGALNAAHLRGSPPDTILFDVVPLDERFPALDDALSWPGILARYRVAARGRQFLSLARRGVPRSVTTRPLATRVVATGEELALPRGAAPLWAQIRIEPTLLGRAASFLFKAPPVRIEVASTDGTRRSWRLPHRLAAGGFLLSPVILTRGEFAALLEQPRGPALRRASSIRILAPRRFYDPRVRVSLAPLDVRGE